MKTLKNQLNRFATLLGAGVVTVILFTALWVWGQSEPLGLSIAPLGNNQFSLTITNGGVSTNHFKIEWVPELNSVAYDWTDLWVGEVGETNYHADMSAWRMAFFRARIVNYYGGIPDYELADPNNPSLGRLTIVIDSPLNGSTINQ